MKEEEGVEDDRCFVCGEGGKLILCDFPNCPRVYHQVSVTGQSEGCKYKEVSKGGKKERRKEGRTEMKREWNYREGRVG